MRNHNALLVLLVAALPLAGAACARSRGAGRAAPGRVDAPVPDAGGEERRVAALSVERPELAKLDVNARELVRQFLNANCDAGEPRQHLQDVLARGAALEPVFWEAHQAGPWPQDVEQLRGATSKAYDSRRAWLRESGAQALGKEEARRQLSVTREQYVDREVSQYQQRFKTAALAGLGLVGTAESTQRLQRIAGDPNDPGQVAAKEALTRIQARER